MKGQSSIRNASSIPSYLFPAIQKQSKYEFKKLEAQRKSLLKEGKKLSYRAASKNMDLIDHGAGVYEHRTAGSIWYREDDTIYEVQDPVTEQYLRDVSKINASGEPDYDEIRNLDKINAQLKQRLASLTGRS